MELGLAVIFGLHSVCSICLTLLNKQLAEEIPFPLTIAWVPEEKIHRTYSVQEYTPAQSMNWRVRTLRLVDIDVGFSWPVLVLQMHKCLMLVQVLFQCLASIPFTLILGAC